MGIGGAPGGAPGGPLTGGGFGGGFGGGAGNGVDLLTTAPLESFYTSVFYPEKNEFYTIGARKNRWTLEALDWKTGASAFHWVIGGQRYNSLFSATLIDEAGRIHYGGPWGRVRLSPRVAPK